jgi:glycosyltransferase involved in cell wall biosynthesis
VALLNTIRGLAAAGHTVVLVAPWSSVAEQRRRAADALAPVCDPHLVAATPRTRHVAAMLGLLTATPMSVVRHTVPEVQHRVAEVIEGGGVDVVHAEQLHALAQTAPARAVGLPIVHRAHNVEAALWAFAIRHRGPIARSAVAREARLMTAWEADAIESATATVTLTESDRRALSDLVPGASVHAVPAPFAAELPAGEADLDGDPVVTTLASPTWKPSRDAVERFARIAWPVVRRRLPAAVLHIFGGGRHLSSLDGIVPHAPPADSRDAFPPGAVAVVPARHPTGVPMKVLEAWARGLPVVADPSTAAALDATDGVELLVAGSADAYADALARLRDEDALRPTLAAAARRVLADRHDPTSVSEHLVRVYRWAIERGSSATDS